MAIFIAIITDGERNSFPMCAKSVKGILAQIQADCTFPFSGKVTELHSGVTFHYGADKLLGKINGEWKPIGALIHRENIPE